MKLPPAPKPTPPARPTNALHTVANSINQVVGAPMQAVNLLNEGFAVATSAISNALPAFPAARLMSLAIGTPHAHILHPPSGPFPIPPTPLPPIGPVMLGTCVSVLINGMPAARCGDLGFGPSCCGIPPIYEIFTGSSKVFIGGARAARATDITYHCKPVPPAGTASRGAVAATRTAMNMAMKAAAMAAKVAGAASQVAQAASIAGDAIEAVESDDAAMAAALGMSAGMAAAQIAADAVAMAMGAAMGKDLCVPPGTPGMITIGSPTVMIGGFPMPSWSDIAKGLLKMVKGLRKRGASRGTASHNKACGRPGEPVDVVTGANVDEFVDFEPAGSAFFVWKRHYDSRWSNRSGPMGPGFRHEYERELRRSVDGFDYIAPDGDVIEFPALSEEDSEAPCDGFLLRRESTTAFEIDEPNGHTMEFDFRNGAVAAPLKTLRSESSRLHFVYDGAARLVEIIADLQRRFEVVSTTDGHVREIRLLEGGSSRGRIVASYEYDSSGRLSVWQDALNNRARYEYDRSGRMSKKTDRRGYSYHYVYDAEGRCVHTRGDDGLYDVRLEYNPAERSTVATFADGASSTYHYDEHGIITRIVDPQGGVSRFRIDESGRVLEEFDAAGNVTKLLYDENGGVAARMDPLGMGFPPLHVEPNPQDPLEYELPETPLEWEFGRLIDRTSIKRQTPHDPVLEGWPKEVVDVVMGGPAAEQNYGQHAPTTATEASRRTFDAMGRVVEEVDDRGRIQTWKYDANGNVLEHQDRDGSVDRSAYTSWNLLQRRIDPTGATTRFEYSLREEVTGVIDPGGSISEYLYDKKDRLIEVRRHGRVKERYRYDAADNLVEKTDGNGRPLLTFDVAPGNLHAARRLASGENHHFQYDERGNIICAATDKITASFEYDSLFRQVKDQRDGLGIVHTLGASGPERTSYLDRFAVRYEKADDDRLIITDPTGAAHELRIGRRGLLSRRLSNGSRELMRYDREGLCLGKVALPRFAGEKPWSRTYRYSGEGDLLHSSDSNHGSVQREYDAAHRILAEVVSGGERRSYEYDSSGNILKKPGLGHVSLASGNRLEAANGDFFTYDDRNNLSGRIGPDNHVRYEYDALDRLVRCVLNGEEWIAEYDPLGRRICKIWKGRSTQFYWDDFRLAAELHPDGRLRLYVYVDYATLVPFMFVEYETVKADPSSGQRFFIYTNQIGAPERVEDDDGKSVWIVRIDPFGQVQVQPGATVDMPLRFPGHYCDAETGLHYNRFRYYSPELGRYLQSDPLGLEAGVNLYAYCSNNPLTRVDIDGLHRNQRKPKKKGKRKSGRNSEPRLTNKDKPTKGAWKNAPNWDSWQRKGGTITRHRDGSVTYTTKKGVSVTYNKKGYPDFKPHLDHPSGVQTVRVASTTDRAADFKEANRRAGEQARRNGKDDSPFVSSRGPRSKCPEDYTWHHNENGKTIELVPYDTHSTFTHAGGVSGAQGGP